MNSKFDQARAFGLYNIATAEECCCTECGNEDHRCTCAAPETFFITIANRSGARVAVAEYANLATAQAAARRLASKGGRARSLKLIRRATKGAIEDCRVEIEHCNDKG